jgi:hypothetical protein
MARELPCKRGIPIGGEGTNRGPVSVNAPTNFQDLRRSTMRNRSFAMLGILALLAAASAFGQSKLLVDIPFEFHFADVVMPAGQYEADTVIANVRNVLSMKCYACGARAIAATIPTGGGIDLPTEGRLVFKKYGETYFLAEVSIPGQAQGAALSRSKTERELARTTPDVARITVPARTSHVVIARR